MRQLVWCLKQLLPLKYRAECSTGQGRRRCSWRMWFGKPFRIRWWAFEPAQPGRWVALN